MTETYNTRDFVTAHGITMTATFLRLDSEPASTKDGKSWDHFLWNVTLRKGTNQLDTPYRMGLGHCTPGRAFGHATTVDIPGTPGDTIWYKAPTGTEPGTRRVTPTPPDVADVLDSLASDASCYDNARTFEEFANDLGYDPDSRKAESIYNKCGQISKALRDLLGGWELYAELTERTERL